MRNGLRLKAIIVIACLFLPARLALAMSDQSSQYSSIFTPMEIESRQELSPSGSKKTSPLKLDIELLRCSSYCDQVLKKAQLAPKKNVNQKIKHGTASWYGKEFHQKITASGERFDENLPTIAHRSLPLGTYVLIINLDNGESAVAKVNDRGPFIKGRIADLSKRIFQELGGDHKKGLLKVALLIL